MFGDKTFPDAYRLSGPWGECMRQRGNAVPVSLARHLGDHVEAQLGRRRSVLSRTARASMPVTALYQPVARDRATGRT